ncbi:uncharacterized protein LOC133346959 isoform X1 [Lethenteron reissneri]|uniref:uncharacterized protein LOC133346959 isoform X1 n=1 Tax=Lethenteron reissneri TaxID=7753 RepID=UPI002AB7268E|nr:uncharacterized protein LOC133346959 isoform X1 [Lethenteron reissneri]XP_061414787.1 uncharacterized protein LOC133346959 isoform X1 [Lethenteron reissneri]
MEPFSSLLLSDRIWVPHAYRWDKLDCTCHLIAVRAGHLNSLLEIVYAEAESGTERGTQAESCCTTPAATADTGSRVELSCGLSVVAEAGTDGNAMNKDVKKEKNCCCCVSTNEDDNSAPPINSTEKEDTTISTQTEREIFKHCCQIDKNDLNIIKNPAIARDAESNTKQVLPGCIMQNESNHPDVTYPIYKLMGNDQSQNTTNLQGGNIDTKELCSSSSFQAAEKANVPNYPIFKTGTDVNVEQSWWKSDKALHLLWLVKLKAAQRSTLEGSDLEKMERARIAWEAAEVSMKGSECVPRVTGTGYNTVVPSIRWSDYVEKSEKLTKDYVSLAEKQEKHEKEFKVGNLREETDQKDEETRLEEDESRMQQNSLDHLFQMMDCYSSLPIMQENTTSGEIGGDTMRVGTSADGDKPEKVEAGCKGNEPYLNANPSVKVQAPVYGSPCATTSQRLYQWMPSNQFTCIQTVYLSQSLYGTLVYHPSMFTVPSYTMGSGKLAFNSFSQMQYVVPGQVPPTRSGCMQSVINWQEQCAPYNNVVYQPTGCNQKQGNVVFSPYIRDAWIRGTRP